MSYLDVPRLHFFGQFTANPSTINNTVTNYNMNRSLGNQAWNPNGRHNYSLGSCPITGIVMPDGSSGTGDPILSATLSTSQTGVLVDLDPQQQGVSQIIGMTLQIANGPASLTASFVPTNFADMFIRTLPADSVVGDGRFSATYQSVLTNLVWSGDFSSPFMTALQQASPNGLSIRFIVDGYHDGAWVQGNFTIGRVAGTIGPQLANEPTGFTNARFLRPTGQSDLPFNYAPAKTDLTRNKIVFDLGNAVPTTWPNTADFPTAAPLPGPLVAVLMPSNNASPITLGTFDVSEQAYQTNAYVQEFDLSSDAVSALANSPTVVQLDESGSDTIVMSENASGAFVNFDGWVQRLNPGESVSVDVWANIFEQPANGAEIPLQTNNGNFGPPIPVLGTPKDAISFPPSVTIGTNGMGSFTISALNPGNPRRYVDGQLYGIGFNWEEDQNPDGNAVLSVHIFEEVPVPTNPTWTNDVLPILNQYSRLYPSMQAIIALNDYSAVVANITPIVQRLQYPDDSPGLMPITREMSETKRQIILNWAANGTPQ